MSTGSLALSRAWYAFTHKKALVLSSIIVAAFLLLMTAAAYAQTVAPGAPSSVQPITAPAVTPLTPSGGQGVSASPALPAELPEVTRDETVTYEDLGTTSATILPDSPFHFFKRFGRGVQEAFTFDPVRDAELKLQHASQQISECQQLIQQKGAANIDPAVISAAIEIYKDKVSEVRGTAAGLKTEKDTQPEVVDRLLNEMTDKQIRHRRVLDGIAKDVLAAKEDALVGGDAVSRDIDRVLSKVDETKDATVSDLTDMLVQVEDSPQSVGVRITNVLDRQAGSEFKELKHLEVLQAVKEKMPEEAKDSLELAKTNTIQKFEAKMRDLPPVARAEKFKVYVKESTSDETKLLALLDQIKQSPGIPTDLLSKIEEAKESAVKKFEKKLKMIESTEIQGQFLDKFDATKVDDLMVLDELQSRMDKTTDAFKKVEETRTKAVDEFKKTFKDADSQAQADQFRTLSRDMLSNLTPKAMRLMAELEEEVRSDPNKSAFMDQLGKDMQRQFEGQYRREGDKFMERMATLDPNDMAVFQKFDFDKKFVDASAKRNAAKFKDYMKVVNDPAEFDVFQERFFDMPVQVVDTIKQNDQDFQTTMQFKVRKMQEVRFDKERELSRAKLDLREREVFHKVSREELKAEDKFYEELNKVSFDDAEKRKVLWEGKINDAYTRTEGKFNEQRKIFEERSKLDPWCDEQCQQIQLQFLEQTTRFEKERLSDELARQQRRIELDQARTKNVMPQTPQGDAFTQACTTPESCEAYCKANPAVTICKSFITGPVVQICHYPSYWDSATKGCVTPKDVRPAVIPTVAQACPAGQYFDYRGNTCVTDPYYRASTVFQTCGYGMNWNARSASCEMDPRFISVPPAPLPGEPGRPIGTAVYPDYYPADNVYCGADFRWDSARRECVSRVSQTCPSGQYFDYYDQRCKGEWKDCGAGFYWDPAGNQCVKNVYVPVTPGTCPAGFHKDQTGACLPDWGDVVPLPIIDCFGDKVWNPATRTCDPIKPIVYCTQEYVPVCGTDGATYSNECYAKQAGVAIKSVGSCVKEPPKTICAANKYNFNGTKSCDYSVCPSGCKFDFNGCPSSCAEKLPTPICPTGQTLDPVTRVCKSSTACKTSCDPMCGGSSYCIYEGGCATGCSPSCTSPAWYDTELKKCVTQKERDAAFGCTGGQYWDSYFKTCRDQYCPTNWKWDAASYSCVSIADPTCKSSCGDTCSGGSWCMFDTKGCATGCSPSCPQNQWYDQMQKKCVGYYQPTTCTDNGYNSGSGSSSCNYTKCPSGCNYGDNGCPNSCYTPTPSTCVDNGFNTKGTSSCNYSTCPNGCSFDTKACPTSCYKAPVCASNEFTATNTNTTYSTGSASSCNYTKCPSGCNYDGQGCPSGCYSSGGTGSCGGTAGLTCPTNYTCVYPSGPAYAGMTGTCTMNTGTVSGVCGDKVCNSNESVSTCYSDCATSGSCTPTAANGMTSSWSCSWSACPNGCNMDTKGCPSTCMAAGDQCKNMAGWHYDSVSKSCVKDGITCSNPTACSTCPSTTGGSISNWCNWDNNGCPTGCQSSTTTACDNDKICESGESPASCWNDCGGCRGYMSETSCKGASCTWYNHADGIHCDDAAHGGSTTGTCNANKVCDSGETAVSCPADCGSTYGYCGDKICQSNEGSSNCPGDCGGTITCTPNVYNAQTNVKWACDSSTYCKSGCSFDVNGCATSCQTSGGACSPNIYNANATATWSCDNSYCKSGCHYTAAGCADACSSSTVSSCTSAPMNNNSTAPWSCSYTMCPNGCDYNASGCATTCKTSTTTGYCGDKICQSNESISSCSGDCGGTTTTTCPATSYNQGAGSTSCNYTTCPNGCTYSGQCPSGCYTSPASSCNANGVCDSSESMATCPADCGGATTTTCPSTTANGNTTSMACNYTNCPNGCTWSGSCPSGCMSGTSSGWCGDSSCNNGETSTSCPGDCGGTTTTSCPSNGYNTAAGSYACNYTTCPNGCTYGTDGCPSACMPSLCTDNTFNMPGTMMCNMTTCPNGCTWGSNSCPSGCMTSMTPHAGFFRRLGSILYSLITLPARAFGL